MSYNIFDRPESAIGSRSFGRKKTLDDLEKDEKFLETSERFLASVGENSDDIFEYLRDSDFNLYSGMRRAMQSGNFTEQQKKDYAYLRNEFDNADLGSLKQFAGLIGDAGIDIATDPTVIVAALAAPFTGGTSLATRTGIAATGLKTAKNFIGPPVPPSLATGALKTEGKKSVKKAAAVTGAEVGAWLGLDNHFRQSTELNTNLRKMYSTPELAGSIALGALTGGLIGGGIQKANLFYSKMNRLYSDPDYLKTEAGSFYDKVYKTLEFGDKIKSKTIGAATSILDTKAKFSPIARKLGKLVREDFDKRLGTITRERVGLGHGELLDDLRGDYHALFDTATAPLRVNGVLKETDELNLIKVLRGDNPSKYSETVQQVALDLRVLLNRVFDDAIEAGLIKPDRKLEDYFPRSWNRRAIQENRDIFEELLVSEKIVKDRTKAAELTDEMLNKNNELFSSHSILLTQARAFKDLNENVFEDFLTNDLNTLMNYYMNAANTIQHKKSFLLEGFSRKSNVNQFIERWITPMDRELRKARGGRGLSRSERRDIVNLYKSVTGQVNYFDSPVMQGIYDATKLANAMAYLPLATVSSLTEAMIPLTKTGGSVTGPVKDALKGVQEGHKIFVQDIPLLLKQKYKMTDSQIQKEMNQVFLAMDEAFAETTNRLSGEGLQNEFLKKVGRGFFRFNMLIPWTKSVQLASFNIGKNLIEEHLQTLSKLSKEGVDVITETATKDLSRAEIRNIQKIKSELFGLGIDIQDGLRWIDDGAKRGFGPARENNVLTGEIAYDDNFYKSVIQGAGRFVNEVIMPVGRDRARIPTFMTNPKLDIFTQFLRYPTVFSNTVLKNYINSVIVNPKVNAPKLGAFALSATSLALATNYWRSNEENRDRIAQEGFARNDVVKAFQRVGLLGPVEYGLRYGDSLEYTKNPYVSAAGLGGPLASDLTGLFLGRYGLTETVARKTPLIGTKPLMNKYFGANIFDPITTSAREIDKEIAYKFGIKERPQSRRYSPTYEMSYRREYSVGGLIPEGPEVPFTKEDPASRINPYTGEPYQEDERTGFNEGGINQEALRSGVRPGEYRLMLRTKEDMDNLNNFASSFKTATESRKLEDMDIAYENFTKLPFSLQMAAYGPNITDLPLSAYEADYFKRKSKAIDSDVELTTVSGSPSSMIFNMPIARYENAEKEMYEGLSKISAASTLPAAAGVIGTALKGAMLPFIRRGIQSKMDTTVGGGGSDVPITDEKIAELKKKVESNAKLVDLETTEGEFIVYDTARAQDTQIPGTKATYEKAAIIKNDLGYEGKDVLDYGSGEHMNFARRTLGAETFEPFPKLERANELGIPDYVLANDINKQYDFITSFSVLNTITPNEREVAVQNIGALLKENGTALITARPLSSVKTAKAAETISESEQINTSGMYQKGYSPQELGNYLIEVLGDDFEVSSIPSKYKLSGQGVLLRKKPAKPNVDLAGYSSALEIKAKEAMKNKNFQTGDDLINYLLSSKRTGLSKQELEFVNLESLKGLRYTPEEIIENIGKDKPQLYRIERSADNPYFGTDAKTFQLDLEEDIEAGKVLTLEEKNRFYKAEINNLEGIIPNVKPQNFRNELNADDMEEYIDATTIVGTQPNFRFIDRTGEYESKDLFISSKGSYDNWLSASKNITLRPILKNKNDIKKYVTKMTEDYYSKPEIQERLFTTVGEAGNKYTVLGSDEFGYSVTRETPSGEFEELAAEVPFDEAQIQVRTASLEAGDFSVPDAVADEPIYPNPMLEELQDMGTELEVEELLSKPLMTKYDMLGDYQLPKGGSKNYREFTLHIQNPKTKSRFYRAEGADFIPDKHFGGGDELAHYRVTERTDTEGKRVLFVEEIQSDIHAQGRKYGYEENVAEDRSDAMYAGKLPDFPYKNDWADLVVRDIIKLAADENFDRVSFINAQEQLSRNLKDVNLYNKASVVKLPKANDKILKVKKVLDEHDKKLSESKNNDLSFKESREADIKFEQDFLKDLKDLDDEYTKAKIIDIIKPGEYDFRDANIDVTNKRLKRFLDRVLSIMIEEVDEYGIASGQTAKLTQAKKYFDNIIDDKDKYLVVTEGKTFSGSGMTMPQISNLRKAIDEGIGEEGREIPFDSFSGDVYDFEFVNKDELINRYGMNPNTKQKLKDALQSENGFASLNEDFYLEDMDVFVRGKFGKNTNMTNVLGDYSNLFNKYDIELLGGQGRKFIDIYKDQIPRSINKFTKKYDKSNKPKITNVLSQYEDNGRVTPNDIYKIYKLLQTDWQDLSRKEIQDFRKNLDNPDAFDIKYIPDPRENSAITIDITDEIKDAISRRRVTSMKDGGLVKQMNNLGLK